MMMHHGGKNKAEKPEQESVLKELIAQTDAWDQSLLEHSTGDWYDVTIAKTQHGSFSDFMLAIPQNPQELDARRAHAIVIAYTLSFYNKYLRGQEGELLKGPSANYPEVTFRKKP
jgi:hypothetical protein